MKKSEKKKRDKALKKRARRKLAGRRRHLTGPMTASYHIRRAQDYPIEGCWVQRDWDKGGLAVVVIARSQPDGNIVFGNYLVDYYCLGLKNTFCNADIPPREFHHRYLARFFREAAPFSISPALAHEIIYGGIEYAAQFGFRPHRDFHLSRYVLDPPELHPRTGAVKFGKDGKPFYVSGPDDNVEAIMRQLTRGAGEGNFHYVFHLAQPPDEWLDDDPG
ncbi:MAG: hypothetical protein L6435_17420 [Anaerolineae bacterium]|nr:hypothetical protein [Anaerolineae bacterium]